MTDKGDYPANTRLHSIAGICDHPRGASRNDIARILDVSTSRARKLVQIGIDRGWLKIVGFAQGRGSRKVQIIKTTEIGRRAIED